MTTQQRSASVHVHRIAPDEPGVHAGTPTVDAVAVEEPLEIRLDGHSLAVVMHTPGDDADLVRGFLLTEGVVLRPSEVRTVEFGEDAVADARLAEGVVVDIEQFSRNLFVSSSCGVCGKASIEAVELLAPRAPEFAVRRDVVAGLTDRLGELQPTFEETGGLHAAGIFDLDGRALVVREDIGRHNAVDKAIGALSVEGWPLPPALLVVSGRQSFEIVQKAAMARLGGVVGVSAPSSLAVELARELGLLLAGFARGDRFNVYAGAERLDG
ncbi:MAG: formate dehydrogenase accessory sulfurtransferase FdhD [Chloroflexota bacterium]|nr:formate dehydrogenase accessory sulfurtransferase FdhD [Chloroflexota bacterium]